MRASRRGSQGAAFSVFIEPANTLSSSWVSPESDPRQPVTKLREAKEARQLPEAQWIVHLGMTGRLLVTSPEIPVAPHTHARLGLASGRELRFVDPRRFGRLEFRDLQRSAGFGAPGEEPLTIGAREFADLFRGRRLCIKAALLNQTLLAGVGNIYADESLFHAGIRPRRRANRVTRVELERLRLALRQILTHAIRLGGSSVSDYVDANGERGFFQTRALRLPADRRALPTLPDTDSPDSGGGTRDTLLSQVPAMIAPNRRYSSSLRFFEEFSPLSFQNADNRRE